MSRSHHFNECRGRLPVMKAIVPFLSALALTGVATPALAQNSPQQSVDIVGPAEAFCTLPTSWQFVSSTNHVSSSQNSGPPGFPSSRQMNYDAYWTGQTSWVISGWIPTAPGATKAYDHVGKAPPGVHD